MPNKRTYYAVIQPMITGMASFTGFDKNDFVHGVQQAGVTTNFRLEQFFELGQIQIYENVENIPDVEMTMEKVLDGYPLIYHMATQDASSRTLAGRSNARCLASLGIFDDTNDYASGTALSWMIVSGAYLSSLQYQFNVNGAFTESVTLVCNNKRWYSANYNLAASPSGANSGWMGVGASYITNPDSPIGSGGVQQRQDLLFNYSGGVTATDANGLPVYTSGCILPRQIPGIDSSGRNLANASGDFPAHFQRIGVSTNLGREELFELGRRAPYHRYVKFPIEVTCEFEIIGVSGDWIEATEDGVLGNGNNLQDESIRLVTREGTRITLGTKNKLSSVTVGGGDTGGANQTITYQYSTFNDLTVMHTGDPRGGDSTFVLYN